MDATLHNQCQTTPNMDRQKKHMTTQIYIDDEYVVADLFCGAGGSSTGADKAISDIGGRMKLVAVNHWPVAVETHQFNTPQHATTSKTWNSPTPKPSSPKDTLTCSWPAPNAGSTPGPGAGNPPTTKDA